MASIHKRDKSLSPYWYAAFYNADGRRSFKSTGTTDKNKAERIALEWSDTAKEGRAGALTEHRVRATMADIFRRATQETLPAGTVRQYFTSWLSTKALEVEESSLTQYRIAADAFLTHLGNRADRPIDSVTLKDIAGFRDALAKRLSAATTNKTLKIVGVAWRQARRDGLVNENLFERVKLVKGTGGNRRPFTIDELKAVLAVCDTEWRGMVLFGYYTGARLIDIAALTWANINLEEGEVHFTAQKTQVPMHLPLAHPLIDYLMALPSSDKPDAPLFPKSSEAGATGTLSNRFHDILAAACLVTKRTHAAAKKGRTVKRVSSELSFHSLRHSAASDLRNHGVTDSVAMALLGHESAAIAKHYTKIDRSALRKAVASLPDVTK